MAVVRRKITIKFETQENSKLFYDYLAENFLNVSIKDKDVIIKENVPFLEEIWRGIYELNIEKHLISILFEELVE